jgi:hypothetical protein
MVIIEDDNDICYLFNRISMYLSFDKHPKLLNLLDEIDIKRTYKKYNKVYLKKNPDKITSIQEMIQASCWNSYINAEISADKIFYTYSDVKKN